MIKYLILLFVVWAPSVARAQNPPFPQGNQPKPENLRLVTPPDLRVEELNLVSVIRDGAVKKINIQVLIRIKNFGGMASVASTALAYMKSPAGTGTQRTLATTFSTPAINPGASFVKVFTFRGAEPNFRPGNFDFWIKADARNTVRESDETNNTSVILSIATPAIR